MSCPFLYYLFPTDAYFVPSGPRLVDALERLDSELELGLGSGAPFSGFLAASVESEGDDRICDSEDYQEFRKEARGFCGEIREVRVELGLPGADPLRSLGFETKRLNLLGYRSLRLVRFPRFEEISLVCPSCGGRQALGFSTPERPDPKVYCSTCGGLTALPETRIELPLFGEPAPAIIPTPCYRFAVILGANALPGSEPPDRPALLPPGEVSLLAERALGCGLRSLLVPGLPS